MLSMGRAPGTMMWDTTPRTGRNLPHARSCRDGRAAVVGGGNSAGQAAMFLADHAAGVGGTMPRLGIPGLARKR
jgi:hypothetical protein